MEPPERPHPSALRARVLTAGLLGPVLVCLIVYPQLPPLAIGLALFLAVGAWEWAALIGCRTQGVRCVYAVASVGLAYAAFVLLSSPASRQWLAGASAVGWLMVVWQLLGVARGGPFWRWPIPLGAVVGWLVLAPCWLCLVWLKQLDSWLVAGLAGLIWLGDSLAYFAGSRWGRHRLAVRLSPGKTWEGVAGGALAAPLVGLGLSVLLANPHFSALQFSALGCLTIAYSIVGDLFESALKRAAGVKDSGRLLPGHGGVLDRIDSLTAAAPIFFLGVTLLGLHA
ncbi:MAG: phosphatidate cytidylyltransferase [Gammaproteobacteria bacterium]|nr:phosphatidate cytidylyltransferase [Gammaproteobacteria bacterium]